MKITTYIVLLVSVIFLGCSETQKDVIIETWENGQTKILNTYSNEQDTTTFIRTFFHSNGKLGSKGEIVNGEKNGLWEWWFDNGNRQDLAHLDKGKYIKERKHWREDGTLRQIEIIEGHCLGECCDGKLIFYNEDGFKWMTYNMKGGNYHGFGYGYYPDGSLERKFYYDHGKKKGVSYEYYPNGVIRAEGNYQENLEEGKWIYKDSLGVIDGYEYFEKGKSTKFEEVHH
ncbi:MAG: hypothetical protein MK105_02265 [Crocinitomicaceae bacterium]|nr:hypothetical protein [Crocinitomicaceae bacterium]